MENKYLTKEELKNSYTYQRMDSKITIYIVIFFLANLMVAFVFSSAIGTGGLECLGYLAVFAVISFQVLAGLIIYDICKKNNFLKNPERYSRYTADVNGFEIENRYSYRRYSRLFIIFKITFRNDSGKAFFENIEIPIYGSIRDIEAVKKISFSVGYDETSERICICEDFVKQLNSAGICIEY